MFTIGILYCTFMFSDDLYHDADGFVFHRSCRGSHVGNFADKYILCDCHKYYHCSCQCIGNFHAVGIVLILAFVVCDGCLQQKL